MSGPRAGVVRLAMAVAVLALPSLAAALPVYVVPRTANVLSVIDSADPGTILGSVPIGGLASGDRIVGIDFRPATGELYGLGQNGTVVHLYTIDRATGTATQIGGDIGLPQAAGAGTDGPFGFDFNPVADLIRVTNISRENFRLNPDTGTVVAADTMLSAILVSGTGYDRNAPGLGVTTLYALNTGASDALVRIGGIDGSPSPGTGVVTPIGPLGVDTAVTAPFDIASPSQGGTALASLHVVPLSILHEIDLVTGAATALGPIGDGSVIVALAIAPPASPNPAPAASPLALLGLALVLAVVGGAMVGRRSSVQP